MENTPKDDPHDDITIEWLSSLSKKSSDSTKCPTERDTDGSKQSDIQRKELPVAKGE